MISVKGNMGGNNFAFMIPDKDIIFHRISKLNFFGKNYSLKDKTIFQAEITFRKNDNIDKLTIKDLKKKIKDGLMKIKFAKKNKDITDIKVKKFKYAYVIYDLNHRKNVDNILKFFKHKGVDFLGRWGSWEYMNSDQVIYQSMKFSKNFK
jgi:protoporphyrinogen oxidase